ncbi:hypothetical protein NUW58_g9103 [Xylaria curta]|uniref:Uncharacterized protein n=1 Tax=Xylaria curta TaxID=42375 RepID=A0ACC1N1N1_9PEZI|nr:hypothetical protein NUW58_g9103 [Xylaria curta]
MADSQESKDSIFPYDLLQGKTNFVRWKRNFRRVAKDEELYDYLAKKEIPELVYPDQQDHLVYAQGKTRSEDKIDTAQSFLKWQSAVKKWESDKAKVKQARKLIRRSVSEGIAAEIEPFDDPVEAINYIYKVYSVHESRVADSIFETIGSLRLNKCSNLNDYLN